LTTNIRILFFFISEIQGCVNIPSSQLLSLSLPKNPFAPYNKQKIKTLSCLRIFLNSTIFFKTLSIKKYKFSPKAAVKHTICFNNEDHCRYSPLFLCHHIGKDMITIISGTNRLNSNSRKIAQLFQDILEEKVINSQIIDLAELPQDFLFTALYENTGKHAPFNYYLNLLKISDKFIFVVPEYNGSFPGALKAFIDGMEYPSTFLGKKCALLGLSSGMQGAGLALSHLTDILNYLGMHVLAYKPKLSHIEQHLSNGSLENERYLKMINKQIEEFLKF
jgi:chromate reductase, NAD(P)H dehydrogenase (quinone)